MDTNYCRLCANEILEHDVLELKCTNILKLNIESKIYHCLQLKISLNDQLPIEICSKCHQKLQYLDAFSTQVAEAQKSLSIIFQNISTKNNASNVKIEVVDPWLLNEARNEGTGDSPTSASYCKDEFEDNEFERNECTLQIETYPTNQTNKGSIQIINYKSKSFRKFRESTDVWKDYRWKCNICADQIVSVKHLRQHYTEVHKQRVEYVCSFCTKMYSYRQFGTFYKHIGSHVNKFKYRCELCGKFSYLKEIHEKHVKSHDRCSEYPCNVCGKTYKTASSLKYHSRSHLSSENRYKFKCSCCEKVFTSKSSLSYHWKTHTGNRELTYCEQCGKGFTAKSNLNLHIKTQHSESRPYNCDQCPKMFKTITSLHIHLKVHKGLKQHSCDVCKRLFSTKSILKRHYSIHTGVLPFKCEYCNKQFRIQQFLKIHLRQHTGERPFQCVECNYHFANSSNYIKHMKGQHGVLSTAKNPVNCNIKYSINTIKAENKDDSK